MYSYTYIYIYVYIYSQDANPEANKGQIFLEYELKSKLRPALLQIEIVRAKDLIAADSGGTSDPYVRYIHIYVCIHIYSYIDTGKCIGKIECMYIHM